jgi:hypothetical protein
VGPGLHGAQPASTVDYGSDVLNRVGEIGPELPEPFALRPAVTDDDVGGEQQGDVELLLVLGSAPTAVMWTPGPITGCAEPVRDLGVELGHLPGRHHDVVAAEQQSELAAQHVDPLVAVVHLQLRRGAFRDHQLPRVHAARVLRQRHDDPRAARRPPTRDPVGAHCGLSTFIAAPGAQR